jgi:hypothetical protein
VPTFRLKECRDDSRHSRPAARATSFFIPIGDPLEDHWAAQRAVTKGSGLKKFRDPHDTSVLRHNQKS